MKPFTLCCLLCLDNTSPESLNASGNVTKKSTKTSIVKLFINHLTGMEKKKASVGVEWGSEEENKKTGRRESRVEGAVEINKFKTRYHNFKS